MIKALNATIACIFCILALSLACSGGGGDPTGAIPDVTAPKNGPEAIADRVASEDRVIWGGYILDIRPEEGTATVIPLERALEAHFDVTSMILKPACSNCLRLDNFSFDKSAGIIDLDAALVNPTVLGGYDVRGVLLLDEWDSGRKLTNEAGLTDFWSGEMYRPDPYIIFAKESEGRYFGPAEEHSSHVTLSLPKPFKLLVPFIVDASYPDHPKEPAEMTNVTVEGTVHPTGYTLNISVDLLDWQDDAKGVYLDCSPLNPLAGLQVFEPMASGAAGENFRTWELHLQYDATVPDAWLPLSEGSFELPIVALDSVSTAKIFRRITVQVTQDNEPPAWTGDVGVDEVWWGSRRAIVSFFPANDPSGPVLYNIYSSTDIPLIPPSKDVVTGWSHYAVETVDGATYKFIVRAEDQAGNEDENGVKILGMSMSMSGIWEQVFTGDLESSPNVKDIDLDDVQDVIFGCDNGKVYSLSGQTGDVKWSYQTGGMVKSSPAIRDVNDDDILDVVVGSNDTSIYALNLLFGSPYAMMTFPTGSIVESSPVCADQTGDGVPEVIVGSFDNYLYAFQGGTGDLLVSYDTNAPVKATPSLEDFDNDSYLDVLVSSGGVVRAINGITGAILWSHDFETGYSMGSPAIGDLNEDGKGDAIVGSRDGVYAFDIANNTMLWSNEELDGNFDTSPALGDFNGDGIPDVAVSSRFQHVFLLDGSDGSLIWTSEDEIYMPTSPTVADMNADGQIDVVVGSGDYFLRILNGADGLTLYKYDTSQYGAVTTIPLIADVNSDGDIDIVFATESHHMFALTTNHTVPVNLNLLPWPKFMRTRSNTGNLAHPLN